MCGIFAVYNYQGDAEAYRQRALYLSKKIRHRGPDWSGCVIANNHIFSHERLAIVGLSSGAQPIVSEDGNLILCVNGEIYNHKQLRNQLKEDYDFKTESDCEVIMHGYKELDKDIVQHLDGMFSFVLLDKARNRIIAARDPIGITTLYYGWNSKMPGTVYFASELKSLNEDCDKILAFPPGHIYDSDTQETTRWFNPSWWNGDRVPTNPVNYTVLREALEKAVRKRLMAEVPYGVLLSGGLDSSLIASIAARETEKIAAGYRGSDSDVENFDESGPRLWPRLHSFSIGLPGSPDLIAAREVAKHLKTVHHEYTFTIQEALDAVSDVIYHLETYDVTTIRASTPMYLLSRKIKAMGVKMVLSGEGADEVFGGYLYFNNAPDKESFHAETVTRVKNLHTADCLRANKSTMAWGVEARVPFLDKQFLEVSMNIDPAEKLHDRSKGRMEKYILRKAFDTSDEPNAKPYLPSEILWRQKEQFSDGVGYSWIDTLKQVSENKVSDDEFSQASARWTKDVPTTKEAYMYRVMFEQWYPQEACTASVVRWIPRGDWGCPEDPSGRAQKVHDAAYIKK
ncbi:asparagine synthase [Rhizopus microsporus var. microsporus]|uniref:asparagine synthase (glutamine-hydrolyzing) n=1 Tax=Rhizopus microsporus var. microsporus TaxID=86635 RepID=A0A1X0R5R9_RHIZD|nr:asparagine synthase [Rhizopus microsporus var. microsporus]